MRPVGGHRELAHHGPLPRRLAELGLTPGVCLRVVQDAGGPLLVSGAMEIFGPRAFFASVAVLHASFALYAVWRKGRVHAVPAIDKGRFVGAPPQVAPTGRLVAPEAKPEAGETAAS